MINHAITAIVLAGGQGSRMGGQDKGLVVLNNKPLYQHVICRIAHQVNFVMINCNRHIERYQLAGYPTFYDVLTGYLGPLSGIYSGLLRSDTPWNLFVSCDTPFLPSDLVSRFLAHIADHDAAYAFDGEQDHPTILLIHKRLVPQLKAYLDNGNRKLMLFLTQINAIAIDFSDQKIAFTNINTPDNLAYWEQQDEG